MFEAILFVPRTGIQWNALPRAIGASTTVHDRFRLWMAGGFFHALWEAGLTEFDEAVGIDWQWQSLNGVMTKAPFGGRATGANPTDRHKRGTKRSQLAAVAGTALEKLPATYEAFLHVTCALICFQQCDRMRISHLAA